MAVVVAWAVPAFAQTVAFITNIKGDVAVDGTMRPTLLAELAKGQKLTVGRDAQMNVMYVASGKEYVLKPGEYEVRDTEVASASGMPPISRSTEWRANNKVLAQVAQTSSASVRMRSLAPKKADNGPKLLFPTSGNVATLQPEFRWQHADAKAAGELTLSVPGQDKPVSHVKISGLTYRMTTKLKPATDYAWTVSMNGAEIGTGTFRTLSADTIEAIEKRRPAEKSDFSDRLLFALYLQEMGAAQEAHDAWARLAQERADLPELSSFAK
jgi:hypothetical protein